MKIENWERNYTASPTWETVITIYWFQKKVCSALVEFTSDDMLNGLVRGMKKGVSLVLPQVWSEDDLIVSHTPPTPVDKKGE